MPPHSDPRHVTGDRTREDLMVLAAWMYYDEKLTQAEIARRLHVSRVAVTRLLTKARQAGIVEIRITKPMPRHLELGRRLERAFGLQEAIVVKTYGSLDETLEAVGRAGAHQLGHVLFPGCRLGVGWSTTVSRMGPYLEAPEQPMRCTVNELAGSFLGEHSLYNISGKIAATLGASLLTLPVPVVVQSEAARDAILREPAVSAALEHARQCDVAIVGLGDTTPDGTMVRTGYLTPDDMAHLRQKGAVGDILLHYYDANGKHVRNPKEDRTISLAWEDILRIPYVMALAAGPTKVEVILGALRGRLCHCLVTDSDTAERVLEDVSSS